MENKTTAQGISEVDVAAWNRNICRDCNEMLTVDEMDNGLCSSCNKSEDKE